MDAIQVRRAQRGGEQAFAVIADAVLDRFLEAAERILRDPHLAEDATQQALVVIWRSLPDLRDPERFEAWSYRALVRVCYAEAKRHRRRDEVPLQPTDRQSAPDSLLSLAERDRVERGLSFRSTRSPAHSKCRSGRPSLVSTALLVQRRRDGPAHRRTRRTEDRA